jgi:hypothetical protein
MNIKGGLCFEGGGDHRERKGEGDGVSMIKV